jgi:hypothetical protein
MLPLFILGAAAVATVTVKVIKRVRASKEKSFVLEITENFADGALTTGAITATAALVVCGLKGFTVDYFIATFFHYFMTGLMFVTLIQAFVWSICVLALIATAYIFNAPINPPLDR